MEKNLTITVSGECNSGKSRLSFLLKKFLRENGFNVKFDVGVDYKDEKHFDQCVSKNLNQVIENIKEKRVINLEEVRLK